MNQPVRLQLSRTKGFSLRALSQKTNGLEAANVARPSPWGNPYHGEGEYDHDYVVDLFCSNLNRPEMASFRQSIRDKLRGKNLACWCKPGEACHADILLEIANQ